MASKELEEGYNKALEQLKKAEAEQDKNPFSIKAMRDVQDAKAELSRWTRMGAVGRGVGRAITDVITGIPDLAAMGINYGIRKVSDAEQPYQLPILGDEIRKAAGVADKEAAPELQIYHDVPGYLAAAYGVKQLAQLGWQGLKAWRNNSKMKKLLGEMPKDEANAFKEYMVRGQNSDSPLVQSAIERMRQNTEYKELFTALEEGAAKAGQKVATVRPSKQTAEEATEGIVRNVQKAVEKVKKARDDAGAVNFEMAVRLGQNKPIVPIDNTLAALEKIRGRLNTGTPEGNAAMAYIDSIRDSFATQIPIQGGGRLVLDYVRPNMTITQVQNKLREFGAQIGSNDAAVNSLSVNTKDLINKAVFGGIKADLNAANKVVMAESDKKAIGYLIKARDQYAKGTQDYVDLIAKGIPKFLRDKPVNEIELPKLVEAYEGLTGSQRQLFRTWVGESRAESLQAIDKAVFDKFKNKAFKLGADGKQTYDLGTLAREWERLRKTEPEKAAMIADALGVKASEFSARMKDALVFTRKMDVGTMKPAGEAIKGQQQASALAGAVGGYPAAKVTDLTIEAVNMLMKKGGISDEALMKMLLTPEGASFLKSASLSPQGRETLEKLTKLSTATIPESVSWLSAARTPIAEKVNEMSAAPEAADEIVIPDELPPEFAAPEATGEEIIVPDELPPEFLNAPEQPTSDPLGDFIKNLPQRQSAAPMAPQQPQPAPQQAQAGVNQALMDRIRKEGFSNPEYVYNAVMTGDPNKRDFILQRLGS